MNPILIIVIIFLICFLAWYIVVLNNIKKAKLKVEEANSNIDVALTKRHDTLTKMLDVVKGYTKHEKDTLIEIVNIRNGMTINEKNELINQLNDNYEQIKILVENYPDLKSNENYITLQNSISEVENSLQTARKSYNNNATNYNKLIVVFPNNIVATLSGNKKQDLFEADNNKKKDVKIDL